MKSANLEGGQVFLGGHLCGCPGLHRLCVELSQREPIREVLAQSKHNWNLGISLPGWILISESWERPTWTGGRGMEVFLRSLLRQTCTRILKWAPCKWKLVPRTSWAKENSWLGLKKCQINSFSLLLSGLRLSLRSRSGLRAVLAGLSWTSCCDEIAVIPGFPQI